MRIDLSKCNPALQSIFNNPNQVITLDANFLIPPDRSKNSIFSIGFYNKIWIQPLFSSFPQLAIHEAVYDEIIIGSLKNIIDAAFHKRPPQITIHKDSDLSSQEMAIRNSIESKLIPYTQYNPIRNNKDDRGEVKSLSYIAAKELPYFASHDSLAIRLIANADKLQTSLDNIFSLQPYEIIFYLMVNGQADKKDMRMLYKYLYYLTNREKNENLEWSEFIERMNVLYSSSLQT